MTDDQRRNNDARTAKKSLARNHSGSAIRISFDLRHSDFVTYSCSAHLRDFWETQQPVENFLSRRVFHIVDTDRVGYVEAARPRPTQRLQMGAATKRFADVVNVRADIKAFATQDAKVDFW